MTTSESILPESWRPVVGYEGLYEVSDLGRVRSLAPRWGNEVRLKAQRLNRKGYWCLNLWHRGKHKHTTTHILVARAFLGPCPDGLEVNHKDRNRANPRLSNLEYVTRSENILHGFANGRPVIRGEAVTQAKLREADVRVIRASADSYSTLARRFGVSVACIQKVKHRQTWALVE